MTAATDRRGLALLCSGTHPFSDWHDQQVSPDARYHKLVDEMQWLARRMQIFGVHFHVGVRSAEKSIAIANGLTAYIPHFLGLSASSPFWHGRDTGLASSRSKVFENLPTAGLPYRLDDWAEFEKFMETLVNAQAITSIREVWWDIRPHPDFGTVELRICDGIPTLREVAGLAALAQCLVEWFDTLIDRGYTLPVPREWVIRVNKWRAARYGIDADIIGDDHGTRVPLAQSVRELIEELSPVASRLGCLDELRSNLDVLEHGPSYLRQRRVLAAGGSYVDVVDSLIRELETDRHDAEIWPTPEPRAPGVPLSGRAAPNPGRCGGSGRTCGRMRHSWSPWSSSRSRPSARHWPSRSSCGASSTGPSPGATEARCCLLPFSSSSSG